MANEATALLAKHLDTLSAAVRMDSVPDGEFLQRFAVQGDEDAFAILVRRHGPMVLRVCRNVLHDAHAAEDAFQATFLVLSRKAGSLLNAGSVGGWLHRVAYRLALKARTGLSRQRIYDVTAAVEKRAADPLAQLTVREAQAILDEELGNLPEKYRAPLVLCYLEGKTRDEAARQLGWSAKLVKSRLEQGRERLRYRLSRRSVTLSAALLGTLLTEEAVSAAIPAALRSAVVQAARAASGNGVSPSVALLAESALGGTGSVKAKVVMGLLLLASVLAAGIGGFAAPPPPAETSSAAKAPKLAKDEKPRPAQTLRVVVLDPRGKPLPDVTVHSGIWTNEKGFKANHDYQTDGAGAVQVELPKTYYIFRLWVTKRPFVSLFAGWEQNELASGMPLPAKYTFRLERATVAGGRIVDEQGKPIAGARVRVELEGDPKPAHGDGRTRYNNSLAEGRDAATTDADGRWRIDNVPDHPRAHLSLLVSHPDYVSDRHGQKAQKAAGLTMAMLRKGTATVVLKRGIIVRGRVTDPAGKPIKDALVVQGDDPYFALLPSKFPTGLDGRFRLSALPPGKTTLTVIAPGWAPQLRHVKLEAGLPLQDFRMAPGKPIRLGIVDAAGRPVPRAYVSILEWRGSKSLQSAHNPNHPKVPDSGVTPRANAKGLWTWASAPDDAVKLQIGATGFANHELEIAGGAADRTIVLKAEHRITGSVTDAATGKPIPAFTVIPLDVFRKNWHVAERGNAVSGKNGRMQYLATRTDIPLRLRVEAAGYRTQNGPEFRVGDDTPRTQDFRLQRSPPIAGVVRDPAGRPVARAQVLLATPTEEARLLSDSGNHVTFTDAAGRFAFPDPGEPCAVVAQADVGFALAELQAGRHDAGTLRLRPWASIRGRFRDGGQPVRRATIFLNPIRIDTLDRPRFNMGRMQTVTGPYGRFEFPRVPPIAVSVRVHLGPWKDAGFHSGPSVPLDLRPGQRAELDLGGDGVLVKGKVKLTGKVPANLDCTYSLNYLVQRATAITPPPEIARLGFDARKGWQNAWSKTIEGQAYLHTLRHWFVKLAPSGAFRISGVPPGEYDLALEIYAKPSGCLVDPLASKVVRVMVTAADLARGELVVPEIHATVAPVPEVGDTPVVAFQRSDGREGALKDHRSRYTVVHFWASWCGPCKQQLPALRRLHRQYTARGLAMLSLSLDQDPAAWRAALKRLDLPWQQGRLAAAFAGASSVPAYWLLDTTGKIVAKVDDPDELAPLLTKRLK